MDNISILITIAQVIFAGIVGAIGATLAVGKLFQRVLHLEEDNKELKRELREVRDKAIACETSLKEREPLTRKRSPVSLSDRGTSLLNDSHGRKFVDENFDELYNSVKTKTPKTAYDIQEYAKEIIESLRNDDRLNPAKDFLFKDGSTLDEWITVTAIYLRDKILEKEKMTQEDVDKKTPRHT